MGEEALALGADTFQFFTRNPRGSRAKAVDPVDAQALRTLMEEHRFGPLLAHAPYTLNPCAADARLRDFASSVMREDLAVLERCLPGTLYILHPGNHVGQGIEKGMEAVVTVLEKVLSSVQQCSVLLETMSGKGTEVGSRFEELGWILRSVSRPDKLGVCLDSCHVCSAGYDIVHNLDQVFEAFDRHIGLDKLRAVHVNDSLTPFASRKDRHARIGEGSIGLEAFVRLVNHPVLEKLPCCLETPEDLPGYAREIRLLRTAVRQTEGQRLVCTASVPASSAVV